MHKILLNLHLQT